MDNTAKALKRQKRILHFSSEEKRNLISTVKSKNRIWNIGDPLHSNKNAVDQAWNEIGSTLGKSVEECKAAWVSLRESYRYRAKATNKFKSGSAGGEQLSEPYFNEDIDWEFAEEMSFLPNVSEKRRTFITSDDSQNEEASTSKRPGSQYEYTPTPPKRSRLASQPQNQEIWQKFDDLLEKQCNALKLRESESESPFKEAFAGFEFLLKQLPKKVADEACCNFMYTLLQKVGAEREKSS
ncbi:uncharacterized protein [Eurosta solidaginis]|uniref:uncharacterized protein n=1 Tax=Eurosta solidaginis TaxID=178769 RepID=UPI0035309A3D